MGADDPPGCPCKHPVTLKCVSFTLLTSLTGVWRTDKLCYGSLNFWYFRLMVRWGVAQTPRGHRSQLCRLVVFSWSPFTSTTMSYSSSIMNLAFRIRIAQNRFLRIFWTHPTSTMNETFTEPSADVFSHPAPTNSRELQTPIQTMAFSISPGV